MFKGILNELYSQQKEIKYPKKEIIDLNQINKEMDVEMTSGTFKKIKNNLIIDIN